ncbi:non-oxidative hydroxyarylic acid decarboxylases subunit C [Bradyrhizobium sp.]|jgi:UbiD family decarboxylase|uniref:non-oxidative hydroxyarylic acid decarboxylases subunit C n=1 Tax=Bradyrhizobium sp. TaxID=376 RepID=UPI002DDCBE4A|nr:non-oxidative hydroxyarylic acid decarboxylases subunit C [Bradyrhizobium sp.]HEV2158010.1 non-oxidative hydroxyarylic acid decarboxylases subunit C [Bradyrhizobium sp.]
MRAYKDLREFLSVLEQERQLLRIHDQVLPEPDMAAAACAIAQIGEQSPAIVFDNIAGFSSARVALNVHGSWSNHALALGMDKDASMRDQFFEFVRRFQLYPGTLERVENAPWQEVVVDKDVNLYELLPLFRLNRGDGGHFIDKACTISRDLDDWNNDDVENVGIYRLQVKGRNRLGIQTVPQHDIAIHMAHAEERGEDLPVAIALGNEPIITLMGATPLLYNQLEYKMAAVMQGAPYRVVKTSKGLDIPWGSEYVLEGRVLCGQRETEGPFGEFPGYYSGCHKYPVIEIDRVSHRKDPVYDAVYVGRPWTEIDFLQAMTTSAPIFLQIKSTFPEVVAVNALYTHGLVVVVSTRIRYGGFAKYVGLRVLTTTHGLGYAKLVIVVDENVDPFDLNQVMWAMSVKVNPAGDIVTIPNLAENLLDPACSPGGIVTKMIIDATTPVAPDVRGDYGEELDRPLGTDQWQTKLLGLVKEMRK